MTLQELWRLKITRAGRILFEVAVEYDEESRTWAEMIRLWVGGFPMAGPVLSDNASEARSASVLTSWCAV